MDSPQHTVVHRTLTSCSPEQTRAIGACLGGRLRAGDVVALVGDLGAGKTCFVQGLARGLGVAEHVASPTFILMRLHRGSPSLCHADAYRLSSPQELEDLGLTDVLGEAVVAVEWAERVLDALPEERLEVTLTLADGEAREIHIEARGERLARVLEEAFP